MTINRHIQEEDVETIRGLYSKYPDFPKPTRPNLPGNGLDGYVAIKDNKIIAATYAFLTHNTHYAWLEWTVADKDYTGDDKHTIVSSLLEYACEDIAKHGYKWVFAFSTEKQKLIPLYEQAGFDKNEEPAYELIKKL